MNSVLSLPWKQFCIISAGRALTQQCPCRGAVEITSLGTRFLCHKVLSKGGHRSSNVFIPLPHLSHIAKNSR